MWYHLFKTGSLTERWIGLNESWQNDERLTWTDNITGLSCCDTNAPSSAVLTVFCLKEKEIKEKINMIK